MRSVALAATVAGHPEDATRLIKEALAAPDLQSSHPMTIQWNRNHPIRLATVAVDAGLLDLADSIVNRIPADHRANALARLAAHVGGASRSVGGTAQSAKNADKARRRWLVQGLALNLTPRLLASLAQADPELAIPALQEMLKLSSRSSHPVGRRLRHRPLPY